MLRSEVHLRVNMSWHVSFDLLLTRSITSNALFLLISTTSFDTLLTCVVLDNFIHRNNDTHNNCDLANTPNIFSQYFEIRQSANISNCFFSTFFPFDLRYNPQDVLNTKINPPLRPHSSERLAPTHDEPRCKHRNRLN